MYEIAMAEHNPFRRAGCTRSVDNDSEVVGLWCGIPYRHFPVLFRFSVILGGDDTERIDVYDEFHLLAQALLYFSQLTC